MILTPSQSHLRLHRRRCKVVPAQFSLEIVPLTSYKGQISATLTSFSRTLDDYSETSKKELNAAKQEKARERLKNFRAELLDYRQTFERLRKDREESVRIGNVLILLEDKPKTNVL